MKLITSQWVCPAHVTIFGFIPTPWVCATICKLVNGDTLKCPTCGLQRPFVFKRRIGVA